MPKLISALAVISLLPIAAMAQPTPQEMSPSDLASQQMIIKLTGENLQYQTQIIALQRQLEELHKQLDAKDPPSTSGQPPHH